MKEVRKEQLPDIQGGSEQSLISPVIIIPSPTPLPPSTIDEGPLLPPTLPQKHVET